MSEIGHNSNVELLNIHHKEIDKLQDEKLKHKMKVFDLCTNFGAIIRDHIAEHSSPLHYGENRESDPMLERVLEQIVSGMKSSGWGREDCKLMFEDQLDKYFEEEEMF